MPMHVQRMRLKMPVALVAGLAVLLLLAGCGSISDIIGNNTNTASGSSGSNNSGNTNAANNCSPMGRPGTTGTLKSIDGNALVIVDTQGQSTNATYDSNTRFTRQVQTDSSAIKQGAQLSISVKQNQDNISTATQIVLGDQMSNPGAGGNPGNAPQQTGTPPSGMGTPPGGMGTPPSGNCSPGQGRGQNQNQNQDQSQNQDQTGNSQGNANQGRLLRGKVDQINNNTLTIIDMNSKSYTITLDSSTAIIEMQDASASDLQTGETVSIANQPSQSNQSGNQNSTIAAQQITILLSGDENASVGN